MGERKHRLDVKFLLVPMLFAIASFKRIQQLMCRSDRWFKISLAKFSSIRKQIRTPKKLPHY